MRVAALRVELRLPAAQSLKEKRALLRPVLEGLRRLGSYSVAEVGGHDLWQRSTIAIAIAARDGRALELQLDKLRRYLDSRREIEVIDMFKTELERPE